jgi:hypothetical protein
MKLPGGRKGKSGAWGTDAAVLEELAAQGVPLARKVLDWRQLSKLKSTYVDGLTAQLDPRTGRVHTDFSMANTSTGRLASTEPNLQNIPVRTEEGQRIRRAFVADPGHVLMSADYSQIELRRCGRPSRPGRTSTRARPPTSSGSRRRRWTARRGGGPRPSISASSTACPPSAWPGGSASARARPRASSMPISASIPASARRWSG